MKLISHLRLVMIKPPKTFTEATVDWLQTLY